MNLKICYRKYIEVNEREREDMGICLESSQIILAMDTSSTQFHLEWDLQILHCKKCIIRETQQFNPTNPMFDVDSDHLSSLDLSLI